MNKLNFLKVAVLGIFAFSFEANAQETVITQNELPEVAQAFITDHFPGQKISRAIKDVEYRIKTEYEVYLDNNVKVEFDGKGNWKDVDGNNAAIPTKFIPEKILHYVAQNFPTQHITQIEKSSSKFEVALLNGPDLEFNAKGSFLRIDD